MAHRPRTNDDSVLRLHAVVPGDDPLDRLGQLADGEPQVGCVVVGSQPERGVVDVVAQRGGARGNQVLKAALVPLAVPDDGLSAGWTLLHGDS